MPITLFAFRDFCKLIVWVHLPIQVWQKDSSHFQVTIVSVIFRLVIIAVYTFVQVRLGGKRSLFYKLVACLGPICHNISLFRSSEIARTKNSHFTNWDLRWDRWYKKDEFVQYKTVLGWSCKLQLYIVKFIHASHQFFMHGKKTQFKIRMQRDYFKSCTALVLIAFRSGWVQARHWSV